MVNFEDFKKIDLRVAKIITAERVEGSDKLVKLEVSLGEETRQIVAGIGSSYSAEGLVGKEIVVVANLEPRKLMGIESRGMLLATRNGEEIIVLTPESEVPPGSIVS